MNIYTLRRKHWIALAISAFIVILVFGVVQQAISFNNQMISLQEMKRAELETTKVEYAQCITKILETNQIAKAYRNDVMELAKKAGSNLKGLNNQMFALIGTQVIPQLSPRLRENVQRELITCRDAYIARVDLNLKPMYINYNRLQRQFPNSVFNKLLFHWKTEELNIPTNEEANKVFKSKKIQPLNLD